MNIYLPIAQVPADIWLIIVSSLAVGMISGLFGVGGGFLQTPILIFLGIPAPVAIATISIQIAASSTTGIINGLRKRSVDIPLGFFLAACGAAGTAAGVTLFNFLQRKGALDFTLSALYVVLLSSIGGLILFEALWPFRSPPKAKKTLPAPTGPFSITFKTSDMRTRWPALALFGFVVGLLGALIGIGGGFMIVPALIFFFRVPARLAVGTSHLQIFFSMVQAALMQALSHPNIDPILAMLLIVGGVTGTQFGALIGSRINGGPLFRASLGLIVLGTAARFIYQLTVAPADPLTLTIVDP